MNQRCHIAGIDAAIAEQMIDARIDRDDAIESAGGGVGVELDQNLRRHVVDSWLIPDEINRSISERQTTRLTPPAPTVTALAVTALAVTALAVTAPAVTALDAPASGRVSSTDSRRDDPRGP
jgi:hypothetical protein